MKLTLQQLLAKVTENIRATQKPVATPVEDKQLSMTPHGPAISQASDKTQFGVQLNPFCQKLVIYDRLNKTYLPAVTDLVNEGILTEKKVGDYYVYSINGKFVNEFRKKNIILNVKQKADLKGICETTKKYKPRDLLRYVYQKYPESTVNSLLRKNRGHQI